MNGTGRAETRRRILAELDEGDASVFEIASSLGMSENWVVDMLRTLRDEAHLITGTFRDGTYRRGAPPAGYTTDGGELTRRAVMTCIAHEALTSSEIAERIGRSRHYVNCLLRDLRNRVEVIGQGKAIRYIALDATPAPARIERVALPLWAAALNCA